MSTLSQFAAGGIKSVQRGTITIASNISNQVSATISSVNVGKSFVSFLGFSTSTQTDLRIANGRIALSSATQITLTREFAFTQPTTVSYEVIEFY